MTTAKGFSVWFSEADMLELHEFIKWKTKKQANSANSDMHFSAASFDVDNSLKETSQLIAQARHELQRAKELKLEQQQRIAQVAQQRNSVSQLDDRSAQAELDRIRAEATAQAESYAAEKNAGRGGRAYITEDEKAIKTETLSWIKRTKLRGGLGGRKTLDKN